KTKETDIEITLKINVEHSGPIAHSLQRYGYEIGGIFGDKNFDEDYQQRYDHLMNYLKY
ncbi:MAG: acetoin utilization protein acuB, partial [Flavobacteriia bacterium]|nr:acetoin utilization protein acuB [Flavobacteriia bacterium]